MQAIPNQLHTGAIIFARPIIITPDPNEYPDDKCMELWEQYHKARGKNDRRDLKAQHNQLATELNQKYKRKVFVMIH